MKFYFVAGQAKLKQFEATQGKARQSKQRNTKLGKARQIKAKQNKEAIKAAHSAAKQITHSSPQCGETKQRRRDGKAKRGTAEQTKCNTFQKSL